MKKLTPKEEDILSYFWTNGPLFIRELLELQEEPKPHYNTLSTIVRVLEEKGYIGYRPYGNTYQYYALVSEDEYRNKTLKNVVSRYFGDSYTRVVSSLIDRDELSVEELEELLQQIKNRKINEMVTFLLYIVKSTCCLTLFYLGYKALLSNETFFASTGWCCWRGCWCACCCRLSSYGRNRPVCCKCRCCSWKR